MMRPHASHGARIDLQKDEANNAKDMLDISKSAEVEDTVKRWFGVRGDLGLAGKVGGGKSGLPAAWKRDIVVLRMEEQDIVKCK